MPMDPTSEVWSFTTLDEEPAVFDKIAPVDGAIDRSITPYLYWWAPLDADTTYDYCISTTNACPGNVWTPIGRNATIHPTGALTLDPEFDLLLAGTCDEGRHFRQLRLTVPGGPLRPCKQRQSVKISLSRPWKTKPLTVQLTLENTTTIRYFTLVGGQPSGTLVLHSDGTFTYTPPANYNGQVGFHFIVTDGLNPPTGPYTATINITP